MTRYSINLIKRFVSDLINCIRLIEKPFNAYGFLRSGHKPNIAYFNFENVRFIARKEDWLAIREVLINDEYSCIQHMFRGNDNPRILDLGANIGCFAMRIFNHCPGSQIVSVEAAEDTFQILESNQQKNSSFNWKVINLGVWGENGPLKLMRRGISMGHRVTNDIGEEIVQGISLLSLQKNIGWDQIDLIKMDIEGGEESVIPAALETLRNTRILIIEVHNDRIDSVPVMSVLRSIFSYHWQLNDRISSKPLYVMANESLDLGVDNIQLV